MKQKCIECNEIAIWMYMPDSSMVYCDSHVPRGCGCNHEHISEDSPNGIEGKNWKFLSKEEIEYDFNIYEGKNYVYDGEEKQVWEYLDENGKRFPCVEFECFEGEGFELEEDASDVLNKMYEKSKKT